MRILLTFMLGVFCWSATAEIYQWRDADGNIHYSDQPRRGAKTVQIQEPQAEEGLPPTRMITRAQESGAQKRPEYSSFSIVKPVLKDTILDPNGDVEVAFEVSPALIIRNGHRIRIQLDNQKTIQVTSLLKYKLTGLSRGTHQLTAMVVDANGQVISETATVTFYVRRE